MERHELVRPEGGWQLPALGEMPVEAPADAELAEAAELIPTGPVANPNRLRLGFSPAL
jgi:hypothetical protein